MAASPQSEISRLMTAGLKVLLPPDAQLKVEDLGPMKKRGRFARRGHGLVRS
jgi:hypothetical protein